MFKETKKDETRDGWDSASCRSTRKNRVRDTNVRASLAALICQERGNSGLRVPSVRLTTSRRPVPPLLKPISKRSRSSDKTHPRHGGPTQEQLLALDLDIHSSCYIQFSRIKLPTNSQRPSIAEEQTRVHPEYAEFRPIAFSFCSLLHVYMHPREPLHASQGCVARRSITCIFASSGSCAGRSFQLMCFAS